MVSANRLAQKIKTSKKRGWVEGLQLQLDKMNFIWKVIGHFPNTNSNSFQWASKRIF
jgi:hypothetical protein